MTGREGVTPDRRRASALGGSVRRWQLRRGARRLLLPLLLLLQLAAGCNALRLAYDNADWLLLRQVEPYLCPTTTQSEALRAVARDFLDWHRKNELPRYARSLRRISKAIAGGPVSDDLVRESFSIVEEARVRASARLQRPLATFGAMLGGAQSGCLVTRLAESRRESLAELDGAAEAWRESRVESIAEGLAPWIGALTEAQRTLLGTLIADREMTRAVVRARHDKARRVAAVLGARDSARKRARLRAVIVDPYALYDDAEEAVARKWDESGRERVSTFLQSLTPAQREHLVRVLDGYAADFEALAAAR